MLIDCSAQEMTVIHFDAKFKSEKLQLNKVYDLNGNNIKIEHFKLYISDMVYLKNDSIVHVSKKMAHLINLSDSNTMAISEKALLEFDAIRFKIGIDSITSVSGIYANDLDPTNGMYWTWQSGYINFKLEGTASNCPARLNKFQWHIGGYMSPFNAQREVELKCKKKAALTIDIQIDEMFHKVDVSKIYQVMSPGIQAMEIADGLPFIFKLKD